MQFELTPKSRELLKKIQGQPQLNTWVGGGDAIGVARSGMNAVLANAPINSKMRCLDYGSGVGRVSVALAQYLEHGVLIGADIIPQLVDFCKSEISPVYHNASFQLIEDENPLYDKKKAIADRSKSPRDFFAEHRKYFDLIVSYSVFTHFTPDMATRYLDFFHYALANSGSILISAFIDTPRNPFNRRLLKGEEFRDAIPEEPLLFALFNWRTLERIFHRSGFQVSKVVYGSWRNKYKLPESMYHGTHYQDLIVATKIPALTADFDDDAYLKANPGLDLGGLRPAEHYLQYGFYENRRLV